MRKLIGVLFTSLALTACTPKSLELSNGLTAGNYKVISVDVTQPPKDNSQENKLNDADLKHVHDLIISDLSAKLQSKGSGQQVGITIALKNAEWGASRNLTLFTEVILWDAPSHTILGKQRVAYQAVNAAGNASVNTVVPSSHTVGTAFGSALGAPLGAGLGESASKSMFGKTESQVIDAFDNKVIELLYPPQTN